MKNTNLLSTKRKSGQGIVEYVILVGLIAIIVWAMIETLGGNLKSKFSEYASDISGMQQKG